MVNWYWLLAVAWLAGAMGFMIAAILSVSKDRTQERKNEGYFG